MPQPVKEKYKKGYYWDEKDGKVKTFDFNNGFFPYLEKDGKLMTSMGLVINFNTSTLYTSPEALFEQEIDKLETTAREAKKEAERLSNELYKKKSKLLTEKFNHDAVGSLPYTDGFITGLNWKENYIPGGPFVCDGKTKLENAYWHEGFIKGYNKQKENSEKS